MLADRNGISFVLAMVAATAWPSLSQGTEVSVVLSDAGLEAAAAMPTDMGMGMVGADKRPPIMIIKASPAKVSPGEITFVVTNASGAFVHEMIVASVANVASPVPYVAADLRVDEDGTHVLGEVPELEPGKSDSLTLSLGEGTYLLFCNMPGHYMARMWTVLTVE